jgi:hypothetical protein
MSTIIVHNHTNGIAATTIPILDCGLTLQQIIDKDIPKDVEYIVIDSSQLPQDFSFRDAWVLQNKEVIVDLSKAKEITKNRLRREREPLLAAQDVLFNKALETGADTSAIVAEKQRLRDITKLADEATTLEQLKNISC